MGRRVIAVISHQSSLNYSAGFFHAAAAARHKRSNAMEVNCDNRKSILDQRPRDGRLVSGRLMAVHTRNISPLLDPCISVFSATTTATSDAVKSKQHEQQNLFEILLRSFWNSIVCVEHVNALQDCAYVERKEIQSWLQLF